MPNSGPLGLRDFIGKWTVARVLTHADGTQGRFEGVAEWSAQGEGALYLERGDLILPQGRFHAERRYLWDADLKVYFDDGRFFHQVPLAGGETDHWCDPDQYDVAYDFDDWPNWSCHWRVEGPRKDYRILTRYSRLK